MCLKMFLFPLLEACRIENLMHARTAPLAHILKRGVGDLNFSEQGVLLGYETVLFALQCPELIFRYYRYW